MQSIFLTTFYAENLSGASYAVDKRLELFERHSFSAIAITTTFYVTNRFYFINHFPEKKDNFCDLTDILTGNIYVAEQDAYQKYLLSKERQYEFNVEMSSASSKNGSYLSWKCYPDGRLLNISYYNQANNLLRTDHYDWRGYLSTRSYYGYDGTNKNSYVAKREHLNSNGDIRIVYYFNSLNKIRRVDWIHEGRQIDTFYNENDLLNAALIYYTRANKEQYLVIADLFISDTLAKLQILNKKDNIKLFIQLHNIQLKETKKTDDIRIGYSYPILNQNNYTGIIALTRRQKQDIDDLKLYIKNNIYYIPENWFSLQDVNKHDEIDWENKESGLIIISARLDRVKQIDHAIIAVKFAHQRNSKIHLEIWGGGVERESLQKLINLNNAQSYIQLKGITNNQQMKQRIAQAQLHLLTSKHEGLPMVLFEAQMGQTPSICYDIDYGPDDMIINRINGDLIAPNDKKYLAMRIEELFSEPEQGTLRYYALNSKKNMEKYSEDKIWQLWEKLMERNF